MLQSLTYDQLQSIVNKVKTVSFDYRGLTYTMAEVKEEMNNRRIKALF